MEDRSKIVAPSLAEALGSYERSDCARFHMPGHKGRGMGGFWRGELIGWDVTELENTDNLHAPTGAILRAQEEMAAAYGAKASFFVVNGSTNAVQAMLFCLSREDKLLLSRDAHRSAVAGAALCGIETETILPAYCEKTRLYGMVTPAALEEALRRTRATAVLITSPNYYGLCADVPALSDVAHRFGALLLVDGAHGAHFPFSDALPKALGGYADLFAHSQHKTMDALTQAASLHLGECRVSRERVQRALALTETSSPSYLLMASLDWSVYMAKRRDWTKQVALCDALCAQIDAIDGLACLNGELGAGVAERDHTRVVINVQKRGLSGYETQTLLERAGVYPEMADDAHVVLITTPSDDPAWYGRLLAALADLPRRKPLKAEGVPPRLTQPERVLPIRDAVFAQTEDVLLEQAEGRVAAEAIGAYPPGIAVTMPGERVEADAIAYLRWREAHGAKLFGVRQGRISVVAQSNVRTSARTYAKNE